MDSVREGYEQFGIDNYYKLHSNDYSNPHEEIIRDLLLEAKENWNLGDNLLDLCCGSGEVSRVFLDRNIEGLDPYTFNLYEELINKPCMDLNFKEIVEYGIDESYDTIICSFAMHLCEESMLPMLLWRLGECSKNLLILTPHKRPNCNGIYGWKEVNRLKKGKVNMVLYKKD